jgi:hypothetical protein
LDVPLSQELTGVLIDTIVTLEPIGVELSNYFRGGCPVYFDHIVGNVKATRGRVEFEEKS